MIDGPPRLPPDIRHTDIATSPVVLVLRYPLLSTPLPGRVKDNRLLHCWGYLWPMAVMVCVECLPVPGDTDK